MAKKEGHILDRLIEIAPKGETFTVDLGDDFGSMEFRRVSDFTEIQHLRRSSEAKARQLYSVLTGEKSLDEMRLQTVARCVYIQAISTEKAVTVEKLYQLSKVSGAVFATIDQMIATQMVVAEATALEAGVKEAKND